MRALTVISVTLALTACSGAPPPADDTVVDDGTETAAPLPTPFPVTWDSSRTALREQSTATVGGVTFDLAMYENAAYHCAGSGNYRFLVASPAGATDAPLWVLLGGDSPGHFDPACAADASSPDCVYHPSSGRGAIDAPDMNKLKAALMAHLKGDFMGSTFKANIAAKRAQAGSRLLVMGGCDDDLYSGLGTVDANNPTHGITSDGFLATAAAIDYTVHQASSPSTHVILHGTGGGAAGAFTVARGLFEHGVRVNGVVSDSYLLNDYLLALDQSKCFDENDFDTRYSIAAVGQKVGFFAEREDFFPRGSYAAGYDVPLFDVYSLRDSACCGTAPLVAGAGGNRSNCAYIHSGVKALVDAGTPGVAQWEVDSAEHNLTLSANQAELVSALQAWVQTIESTGATPPTW